MRTVKVHPKNKELKIGNGIRDVYDLEKGDITAVAVIKESDPDHVFEHFKERTVSFAVTLGMASMIVWILFLFILDSKFGIGSPAMVFPTPLVGLTSTCICFFFFLHWEKKMKWVVKVNFYKNKKWLSERHLHGDRYFSSIDEAKKAANKELDMLSKGPIEVHV